MFKASFVFIMLKQSEPCPCSFKYNLTLTYVTYTCLPCLSIKIKHYKLKLGFSLQRFCKTKRMECRKSIIFCTQQRPKKRIVSSKRLLEVFHKNCQFTNPAHYAKRKNQDYNINIGQFQRQKI